MLSDVVEPILDQHEAAEDHRFPASERWRERVEAAVGRRELSELTIAQLRALEDAQLDESRAPAGGVGSARLDRESERTPKLF